MKILAHRGYWNDSISKNSLEAIDQSLRRGYGFESDVRDYCGDLVISHNVADGNCPKAEDVFKHLKDYNDKYCFAINIKADGLKDILKSFILKYGISNYFLFDMSVPQMIEINDLGLRFFTRQSEVEPKPCMYEDAAGVWVDGFFGSDWITEEMICEHIANGKVVCLVSPDLHGRDYMNFWTKIKMWKFDKSSLMICTDHPDEAKEFFYE